MCELYVGSVNLERVGRVLNALQVILGRVLSSRSRFTALSVVFLAAQATVNRCMQCDGLTVLRRVQALRAQDGRCCPQALCLLIVVVVSTGWSSHCIVLIAYLRCSFLGNCTVKNCGSEVDLPPDPS